MRYSTKTILDRNSFEILKVLKDTDGIFVAKIRHYGKDAVLKIAKNNNLNNEWTALKKLVGTDIAPEPATKRDGFIIESFIDGVGLSDALTEELSISEALFLMRKLAEALSMMAKRKIYMRDSHFSNYIVDKSLNVVCIDFGESYSSNTCNISFDSNKKHIRLSSCKHYDSTVVGLIFYFMFKDVLSVRDKKHFIKNKCIKLKWLLREIIYQQSLLKLADTDALKQKLFHNEASLTC